MFSKEYIKSRGLIFNGRYLPYNPKLIPRAKELRKNMTTAEEALWQGFLKTFPNRFIAQKPIDNYIADFYCPSHKLVVEIDGEQHYTDEGKIYDGERDGIFKMYGLKVVRIKNSDIFNNFDGVCNRISEYLE